MLAKQRKLKILELIREEGSARVRNLSKLFSVSEPTIRQDLEKLESEGFITRIHGGAFLKSVPQLVQTMTLEHLENMDKKRLIGQTAAGFVEHGETIILDAGSTTTEMIEELTLKENLKILTNALNIVLRLGALPNCTVFSSGGQFKPPTLSLTGEKAADFFTDVYASKLFLATGGISFDAGLTYPGFNDLYVKKAMIKAAKEVFLLADASKIGKVSFASLGGLDLIDYFITDSSIKDEDHQRFQDMGVKVIIAK
ncbi:MAG: DeoR/GlpR transcriptional regulator [Desulfobacteraceae bacterium]|nr:MAG: DeoR/GlpR transcriptional regulator [Desulfobacteraceae bacterium]